MRSRKYDKASVKHFDVIWASLTVDSLHSWQIYTDWANHYLEKARNKRHIHDLQNDVADGVLLAEVIEAVTGEKVKDIKPKPKNSAQMSPCSALRKPALACREVSCSLRGECKCQSKGGGHRASFLLVLSRNPSRDIERFNTRGGSSGTNNNKLGVENINTSLTFLAALGVSVDGVSAKDIKDGNLKSILGLFFSLSRYKQQQKTLLQQQKQQQLKQQRGQGSSATSSSGADNNSNADRKAVANGGDTISRLSSTIPGILKNVPPAAALLCAETVSILTA
ncbi:hypothetical protein EGW08_011192 [Elysia chlorotica]|uniref:Calponin-homology (CH) domain-containing protein n=1 Tax=Elysia chlorotica TaxID=188477 RepID=A0A433THI3_ELYCH|nr:hypothetical protein EGW08_011192 [Elysia chlorotica]